MSRADTQIVHNPTNQPTFGELTHMANAVAKSGLFGCRNPEQAMTLMLLSQAEGLHPIQAMRQFHIIEGRPSIRADAAQARFMAKGGRINFTERTDRACEAIFSHPSTDQPVTIRWTIEDAVRAEIGNNKNWKKYPRQMLHARVISEGVRAVLPEVICGLYVPEEVADMNGGRAPVDDFVEPANPVTASAAVSEDDQFVADFVAALESHGFKPDAARAVLDNGLAEKGITLADMHPKHRTAAISKALSGGYNDKLKAKEAAPAVTVVPGSDAEPFTADIVKDNQSFFAAGWKLADSLGISPDVYADAIERADPKTPEQRTAILVAIRAGTFDWETGTVRRLEPVGA